MANQAYPAYAGQSPNHLKLTAKERQTLERASRKPPKNLLESIATVKCPDCFCILKALKPSDTKEWLCQCKNFHCYKVNLENGRDRVKYEKIPSHDPLFPRRNFK